MQTLKAYALAALPETFGGSLPSDIQVFPPGKDVEFTLQDYPGQTFKMDVDESVAAKAQEELSRMQIAEAVGSAPTPFADKNHEDSEAVFHPVRFFWGGDDPKAGGVRVETKWTPFGAALVRAKAFRYFSGNFLFNKVAGKFLGLINQNIGGLVNRPGFTALQAFAKASDSINDFDIKAAIRKMNKTHDVNVSLDAALIPTPGSIEARDFRKSSPLILAAGQRAAQYKTNWVKEYNRLILMEPDIARWEKWIETGMDDQANEELDQDLESLKSKEGAEALAAAAKAYQQRTGFSFEEAWTMAQNEICGTNLPHDQRTANAAYTKAMEYRRQGIPFDQAYARARADVLRPEKYQPRNLAILPPMHSLLTRERTRSNTA